MELHEGIRKLYKYVDSEMERIDKINDEKYPDDGFDFTTYEFAEDRVSAADYEEINLDGQWEALRKIRNMIEEIYLSQLQD
jgi:hypothetical protein